MQLEPIQHVWLNHDNDLVDVTLVAPVKDAHGKTTQQMVWFYISLLMPNQPAL
jgi:hypothetical protein